MAGFCTNSNRWLSFLAVNPKTCPYELNGSECESVCGYYDDRPPSRWYRRKKKAIKALGLADPIGCRRETGLRIVH